MKQTISILIITVLFSCCGNSNEEKAVEHAKDVQTAIRAGAVATTVGGYTMKAKLDGKDWIAASMMQPYVAGRIVGYYNNGYIGLPYDKRDMVAGKKIMLGDDNAVDLLINNGCLWKDMKGEMEITKVDDTSAEGKFFFTTICSSSGKAVEVTDGFFRILFSEK